MGIQGNSKATHDFLSLYASAADKDPSLQLHDSEPAAAAASQGFFLKTHDFLQPLEKPAAASVPDRQQQQHALPGGIGTFTVSQQVTGAGGRPAVATAAVVVKPEPPQFVLWGQPTAAQPISAQAGHHHQWTLPFAGAGQAATAPRQHPPGRKRRAGGRGFMESGSRSNGGDGFDTTASLRAARSLRPCKGEELEEE